MKRLFLLVSLLLVCVLACSCTSKAKTASAIVDKVEVGMTMEEVEEAVNRDYFIQNLSFSIVVCSELESYGNDIYYVPIKGEESLYAPYFMWLFWGVIVEDLNPSSYAIYIDGELNESGAWNNPVESISIDLDNLDVGEYEYTIIVTDKAGNSAFDTVDVVINEDPLIVYLPYILLFASVVVIVLVGVVLYRRR